MIRHSSSFFISLILHVVIIALLFLLYKEYKTTMVTQDDEHIVCVQLSYMHEKSTPPSIVKQEQKIPPKKIKKQIKKKLVKAKIISKPIPIVIPKVAKQEVAVKKNVVPRPQKIAVQKSVKTKKIETTKKERKEVKSPEKEYVEEHLSEIIALIQDNLYYPRRARKRGVQGKVIIRFTLSKNAEVSEIEVLSSKSDILSRGAIKTIENIEYKFPKPKERLTFNVPISYSLD